MNNRSERLAQAKAELEQINNAIASILDSGKSAYHIGSRGATNLDLATLYKRKAQLEDTINALTGGSGRFRRVIPMG
jgi:hypothetical protein